MRRELGAFETAQVLTGEYAPFNATIALKLDDGPAPETLQRALEALQRRFPLLAVRVVSDGRRRSFETGDVPSIPLEVVTRTSDVQWREVVEDEVNRSIDAAVGPLARCVALVPTTGAESDIVLSFHHVVMDSVSGEAMVRELLTACDPGSGETAPPSPRPAALPPSSDALFPAAARGLAQARRTASFVARQIADEVGFRLASRGRPPAPPPQSARCRILTADIGEATTRALVRRAREARVGLNSVLNAAQLVAVWRLRYGSVPRPMRYITFADLRPYLEPPLGSDTAGCHISMLRFTMAMRTDHDLWQVARNISSQTQASFRRGDKFTSALLSPHLMRMILRMGTMRMASVALSYGGFTGLEGRIGRATVHELHAFVSNLRYGPEFTALVRLSNNRLWWDMLYLDGDMDPSQARRIANHVLEILDAAAKE